MPDTTMMSKSAFGKYLPLMIIVPAALLGAWTLGDYLSFETLRDNREALLGFRDANLALAILTFVAIYVAVVAFSLPGGLFVTLAGGFLFGAWLGTLLTVFAATLGATLLFLAARAGFGEALARRMDASEGKISKIKRGLDENQWSMLFFIRLVPFVPFFVANLLPAFVDVPVSRYVISTFFGIIPGTLVFASVGAGLGAVFETGAQPDLGLIFEPQILWPILGLAGLALLPVMIKALARTKGV